MFVKSLHASKRICPAFRHFFRKYGMRQKLSVEIDSRVAEELESLAFKPKRHPGIINHKTITIPEEILAAIRKVAKGHPWGVLSKDCVKLSQYLSSRHLPPEEEDIDRVYKAACSAVENKYNASELPDEEKVLFRTRFDREIRYVMKQKLYSWKNSGYDEYKSKLYLISRAPPEYAVLHWIFLEMKQRVPDFKPQTIFDFGSGVGTVTWAANSFWKDSLKEYFLVDASSDMNDLAKSIIKADEKEENIGKGIFFRQFLPVSHSLKYDLVVSAFSLMELPNLKSRLETVLTLWKKTQGYLILVEQGTNAGFQAVNEAREFILEYCNDPEKSTSESSANVFAPCPHNKPCPRFEQDNTPCNFEVSYQAYHPVQQLISTERFSYVVIKKGLPAVDKQWPRIVRPVLLRSKHIVCRMCTASGNLEEVVVTASKHGKHAYKCAKYCKWGDLFPVKIINKPVTVEETNSDCEENS